MINYVSEIAPFEAYADSVEMPEAERDKPFLAWVAAKRHAAQVAEQSVPATAGIAPAAPSGASVDSDGLLPCAHCGGPAEITDHRLCWSVECKLCGSHITGKRATEQQAEADTAQFWAGIRETAITAWNCRADLSPTKAAGD